jgi:nucleotide-binding universal stress UspA family protein
MAFIRKILYPVNFSPSCIAMGPYVKRAADMFGAEVFLIHVVEPGGLSSFELYSRPYPEVEEEQLAIAKDKLHSFLTKEFPAEKCQRIVTGGDPAREIAQVAREGKFDLIVMPTHAGFFREMLIGSTTAKVLNDADCPVLTSRHAEKIVPRPLDHREWLCAVGMRSNADRVIRLAKQAAAEVNSKLSIIHAVRAEGAEKVTLLDLEGQTHSTERQQAGQRVAEIQQLVGPEVPVQVVVGSVKQALLEAAGRFDADVLIIGRSPQPGSRGRMRDLTYTVIRDSPFPVLSV